MYPTFSLYGSLGSGYNSRAEDKTGISPVVTPVGKVTVGGVNYDVFPIFPSYAYSKTGFFRQVNQNFRQSIGLTMNVPIFNGGSLRTAYEKSKINIKNQELQVQLDDQTLKQNIYQAYNAAKIALEKFNASKKSTQTAERSFSFSQKRYDVGLLGTFELITNQNNLFRAKLEYGLQMSGYSIGTGSATRCTKNHWPTKI